MILEGGISKNYTQNWDKNGNIYYTDENGQVVDFKVNPFVKLANKVKATATNIGDWINETDPNSEAYKQKVSAIAGLETLPLGLGRFATQQIAKGLTPYVGRKIAQNMATGASGGVAGGAVTGGLEAGLNDRNIAIGGLQGATVGGLLGGLGGYGLGKVAQKFERAKLPNNPQMHEQYFNDYIADLNNKTNAMADFRAGKLGMKNGKMQLTYDLADDVPEIPKYIEEDYIIPAKARYYEGGYTSPKINKILDYIHEGHNLDETYNAMQSPEYNLDRITKIYDDFNNGVYRRIEAQPSQQSKRQILNPEWRPKFDGSNFDEIIDDYNSRTETAKVGRGYSGYSMSNNAVQAYNQGSKPISKWKKSDIINSIDNITKTYGINIDIEALKKLNTEELKKYLIKDGYHHTSKYYNTTYFYKPNISKILGVDE